MHKEEIRWIQRFSSFKKAFNKLSLIVENKKLDALNELETEGLIQRFEYTYELAWKTLQDFLRHKGYIDIAGPTSVLQQAFADGYIEDEKGWRNIKKSRELTAHTYNESVAEEIAESIMNSFYLLFKKLITKLENELNTTQSNLFE